MKSEVHSERRAKWLELVEKQEQSGLSQTEYCKQHNITLPQFSYYRGLLKSRGKILPQKIKAFTPIKINKIEPNTSSDIRIVLPNGFQCFIPCSVDTHHVKRLMEVLLSC